MTTSKDRLKRLLDGDLETSEITEDAALVSLADRLYGIKIANVKPVKARDMETNELEIDTQVPNNQSSNLMVEVLAPKMPAPTELPHLEMPTLPQKKNKLSFPTILSFTGLTLVITNLFGLLSSLFESTCEIGSCRSEEQTRINLLDIHNLGHSDGWSNSILSNGFNGIGGETGSIGIPDIAAIIGLIFLIFLTRRKK